MNEAKYIPRSGSIAKGWTYLFSWLVPLEKVLRTCENRVCLKRSVLWPEWLQKDEGICLQGQWYCGPECFEKAVQAALHNLLSGPETKRKRTHRIPIGLLLLSRGMINDAQLKQALVLQREKGSGKIGKFLQQIQAATERDITEGLAAQWGCPVYPLGQAREFMQCASLLPLTLLETGHMLPVRYLPVQQSLYLAFVEGVDRSALYAVEQMLHLRTIPCIVPESELLDALELLRRIAGAPATVFESPSDPHDMARTTRSYALQVGAKEAWMARSGRFIWIRLQTQEGFKDILFQALGDVQ